MHIRTYNINLRIRIGYCIQTHNYILYLYDQTVRVGSANNSNRKINNNNNLFSFIMQPKHNGNNNNINPITVTADR